MENNQENTSQNSAPQSPQAEQPASQPSQHQPGSGKKSNPEDWKSYMAKMDQFFEDIFAKKMPAFPQGLKDFLVKAAPYLVIIGLVFQIIGLLSLFGVGSFAAGFLGRFVFILWVSVIFNIIVMILQAMALPGLFNKTKQGWTYIYYSVLVSAVMSILTMNLVGLVIGVGLGLWVMYQIKPYYK